MLERQSLQSAQRISLFVVAFVTALTGFVLGVFVSSSHRAEGASLLLFFALMLYVGIIMAAPRLSWLRVLVALFMVSVHLGAVSVYYSDPLVLPFLVIERGPRGNSINFDFVQLVLAYEVISAYLASKSRSNGDSRN